MKKFTKQYQRWNYADGQYSPVEFDTLEDAMLSESYDDNWYITKKIDIVISEKI